MNWGNSSRWPQEISTEANIINHPEAVGLANNKLKFFKALKEERSHILNGRYGTDVDHIAPMFPDFTEDREVAQGWLNEGGVVVERHKLTGNSGQGIRIVGAEEEETELQDAPLYTRYFKKKSEFRIHVVGSRSILAQKKVLRADADRDNVNWKVRNHDGGFIFQQNGIEVPPQVLEQALIATSTLGLDFGAVDIMYNEREDQARILEVNTAPGLAGTTGDRYAEALQDLADRRIWG